MNSPLHRFAIASFLAAWSPLAGAQTHGLTVDPDQWPRWQARLAIVTPSPLGRTAADRSLLDNSSVGIGLMSDYYLTRALFGPRHAGGIRATGGLVPGARRSGALGAAAATPERFGAFSVERRIFGQPATALPSEAGADPVSLPYVGVGYTGLASSGRWGYTADVGLVANGSRSGLRLGRTTLGTAALDEAVRDMRWSPVLQLGVTYSF